MLIGFGSSYMPLVMLGGVIAGVLNYHQSLFSFNTIGANLAVSGGYWAAGGLIKIRRSDPGSVSGIVAGRIFVTEMNETSATTRLTFSGKSFGTSSRAFLLIRMTRESCSSFQSS